MAALQVSTQLMLSSMVLWSPCHEVDCHMCKGVTCYDRTQSFWFMGSYMHLAVMEHSLQVCEILVYCVLERIAML